MSYNPSNTRERAIKRYSPEHFSLEYNLLKRDFQDRIESVKESVGLDKLIESYHVTDKKFQGLITQIRDSYKTALDYVLFSKGSRANEKQKKQQKKADKSAARNRGQNKPNGDSDYFNKHLKFDNSGNVVRQ